jgi:AcrR family transcriptional regulator
MPARNNKPAETRFSREAWLEAALTVLSDSGDSSLRIARISSDLNVSKGSFYWHFKNREDFLHAIVEYWKKHYTEKVKTEARKTGGNARQQLQYVLEHVTSENLSEYDTAFDGWASHEPAIADAIKKTYQIRWRYIRSLFAEMGFGKQEAEFRTQAFIGFMKFQSNMSAAARKGLKPERFETWIAFFTRP